MKVGNVNESRKIKRIKFWRASYTVKKNSKFIVLAKKNKLKTLSSRICKNQRILF